MKQKQFTYTTRYDHRDFSKKKWTPNPLEVIANNPKNNKELEEAKNRVTFEGGRYQYTPSLAYKHHVAKYSPKRGLERLTHEPVTLFGKTLN